MKAKKASYYFVIQGLAGLVWWVVLFIRPETRSRFLPPDWPDDVLLTFLVPDLILFVGGSWVLAVLIARGSALRRQVGWLLVGAMGYGTLYAGASTALDCSVWMASAFMVPAFLATTFLVVQTCRVGKTK